MQFRLAGFTCRSVLSCNVTVHEKLMIQPNQKKNFMKGKGWLVFLMAVGSAYGIFNGISQLKQSQKEREAEQLWNESDRQILIANCIRDSKDNGVKYANLTREYCDCSMNRIMSRLTKSEYVDVIGKSIDDQKTILMPIFQDCLTEYQKKINASGRQRQSHQN